LCDYAAEKAKEQGVRPLGIEGDIGSDWVLLDLGDVIVHAMTAQARGYYQLEKLWSVDDSTETEEATTQT
jgi:ribosome-associated protein